MTGTADQNQSRIKPAAIALTQLSDKPEESGRRQRWRTLLLWTGLTGLALLVYAVVFILPDQVVNDPAKSADSAATTPAATKSADTAPATAISKGSSPWTEAQLAKQRQETQEILSEMLKQQDLLEQIGVKEWAAAEYTRALQLAEAGDALYRQREFAPARESYQAGLAEFKRLQQQSEIIFADAISNGNQALTDGDTTAAQSAFQLALLINPDATEAGKGKSRADTLDQVLGLLVQGDALAQAEQLAEAAVVYKQALALDPDHSGAGDRLSRTRQRLTDREFTAAMSNGYAALANDKLQQARASFQQAMQIKPAAQEARDALRQTDNKITVIDINKLLAEATQHEQAERWPGAVTAYDQALQLDTNLAIAQTGKQNAELRADLDQRLAFAIANPLRLTDHSVYTEVSALQKRAMSVAAPGPKLQNQIAALQTHLQRARQPLLITLQSDNLTDITLYRTGKLGQFQSRQVELIPGHYVVVGKRTGYQDVRVEFTVDPDKPIQPVLVQCENKITYQN